MGTTNTPYEQGVSVHFDELPYACTALPAVMLALATDTLAEGPPGTICTLQVGGQSSFMNAFCRCDQPTAGLAWAAALACQGNAAHAPAVLPPAQRRGDGRAQLGARS